jgi:periplasmic divalent cation tolerance protein
MSELLMVFCTCPAEGVAEQLAAGLVERRLAACVNIVPQIRSIYRWDGEIQKENEALMIIKSTDVAMTALSDWLKKHHPYDVPEILALPVHRGSKDYMNWIINETETN